MSSLPSTKYMVTVQAVPLTTSNCKRCKKRFQYYRRGRHRYFCEPCKELEKKDHNDFSNELARRNRLHARTVAREVHG
jgi:hypothetical protein